MSGAMLVPDTISCSWDNIMHTLPSPDTITGKNASADRQEVKKSVLRRKDASSIESKLHKNTTPMSFMTSGGRISQKSSPSLRFLTKLSRKLWR